MSELERPDAHLRCGSTIPWMPCRTAEQARSDWDRTRRVRQGFYEKKVVELDAWLAEQQRESGNDFPGDDHFYTWREYAKHLWGLLHWTESRNRDLKRAIDGDALRVYRDALNTIAHTTTDPRAAETALRAALDITQAALDKARLEQQAQQAAKVPTPEVRP